MARHGKRFTAVVTKARAARNGGMPVKQGMALVKEMGTAKFDETVDAAIRLGVDTKRGDQMVRGTVVLPHGTGKAVRVAVIASGDKTTEAERAGADAVGGEDLITRIDEGWRDFDVLVATRDMMRSVSKLGKKLGPRMPNPKSGTLSDDVGKVVEELKKGKVEFRMDKGGVVQVRIGRVSFSPDQLTENLASIVAAILRAKPAAAKGQYLRRITVSSTMGPSVAIDLADAEEVAKAFTL